ncbi:MAG TPA: NUDIX domain-containing protein [Allosphingosinicella sp.]|nr:NUDIX domain-containing protein [Allosphingosinicella sp.]
MSVTSAGILLYRRREGALELLLIHPGGPYWRSRDDGAWMMPKGQVEEGEDYAACAIREFQEELGIPPPGLPKPLCRIRQKGGKWVEAFALEGDLDCERIVSNSFELEWPPRSGQFQSFPEVDRAEWFALEEARRKILASQLPLLEALERLAGD